MYAKHDDRPVYTVMIVYTRYTVVHACYDGAQIRSSGAGQSYPSQQIDERFQSVGGTSLGTAQRFAQRQPRRSSVTARRSARVATRV